MGNAFESYRSLDYPLPATTLGWNLYGVGLESMGKDGKPEAFPMPTPGDDQLLVRIDSVGVCFSDIKVLKQGSAHAKLYNRDLTVEPTRLGHEVSATIIQVGRNLQATYQRGQRVAVQPDTYQQGKSTAYGYTVPGGLMQYHLIGPEVLVTDAGACLLPLDECMGYAESSLLEPWGCVMGAYTQRRRLAPKSGGSLWIVGQPGDTTAYRCSLALKPASVVLTDAPASVRALAEATGAPVTVRDGVSPEQYAALAQELAGGAFDDIIVLDPTSAQAVGAAARVLARRGTFNLVGRRPLDGPVQVDLGRLHYDYVAFLGSQGPDLAAAYGTARNRCELRAGGTAVFVGAGGPMGQMHVQRALELPDGPRRLIATEVSDERLETLRGMFAPLAAKLGREIIFFNPVSAQRSLADLVQELTGGEGVDDVVVCVPVAKLMEEAGTIMKADAMLVAFAGIPNGTYGALDLGRVYLGNAQYTGTSGLTLNDQALVMERRVAGTLSPGRSVAAIGGLDMAAEAIQSVMDGKFPGKVVVFPQIPDLPLMGLKELAEKLPDVAAKLGEDLMWTNEAEAALIDHCWKKA